MHNIVYVSRALVALEEGHLEQLLRRAREYNLRAGITGVLVYGGERFLQVLEGPAAAVQSLFARIELDPRHTHLDVLADGPVARREFAQWSMSFTTLSPQRFAGLLGYLTPAQLLQVGAAATVQQVLREFLDAGAHFPFV